jgi:hypothetical protein
MAFTANDNFESYTDGNSLNGGSGGSGWDANWTASANFKITTAGSPPEGSNCVKDTDSASSGTRTFSAEAAGTWYYSGMCSSTSVQGGGGNMGGNKLITQFRNDGYIKYFNGSIYANYMTYSATTWYRIGIEWDNAGHANQWRMNAATQGSAEGTWTSWVSGNGTWSNIATLSIGNSNAAGNYSSFDLLSSVYSPTTPTSIKTINGLAKASIKTVNSLAIASVKTWNGLA